MTTLIPDRPATGRAATELPLPVIRWLEPAWRAGVGEVTAIRLGGTVRLRRGRLWMPGDTTMRFDLGERYVSDIRIGIGPITAVRGLDAYVDQTGISRVGGKVNVGPEIDQGAFIALWSQSILFPAAWTRLPGLRWGPLDDARAGVDLPFRRRIESATIHFDPDGEPWPVAFEADRYKVAGGPKVPWRVDYLDWRRGEGVAVPTRVVVTWADEPGPWFDLRIRTVVTNEPVGGHVERARRAIAEARRSGR
jgi:Family of unknown function (DUF6544)